MKGLSCRTFLPESLFLLKGRALKFVAVKVKQQSIVARARWCVSFFCKLRGLTFRRKLSPQDAIILVESSDSTSASAIHMMFVFFPIATIWINSGGQVVDCRLAKPFRPIYIPRAPARYILEGPPAFLDLFQPGDQVEFETLTD